MLRPISWTLLIVFAIALSGCRDKGSQPAAPAADDAAGAAVEAVDEAPVDLSAVVATVNGTPIAEAQVQTMLEQFLARVGGQLPPEQVASIVPRVREQILDELIMRQVMLDKLAEEGLDLTDEEFAEIRAELARELPPGRTMESYMAEIGISEAELRQQMAIRKMVLAQADAVEQPTAAEVREFYEENKAGFAQDENVTASHILISFSPEDGDEVKAEKRGRAEALRAELLEGADFAELAEANSDCPSHTNGGDLGSFGRGMMVAEFEQAAFSQDIGEVGEVVETQFGYHIVKVTAKSEGGEMAFDEVSDRIREILYSQKQEAAVRDFLDAVRENANVERFDAPASDDALIPVEFDEEEEADAAAGVVESAEETVAEAVEEVAADAADAADDSADAVEDVVEDAVEAVEEAVAAVEDAAAEVVAGVAEEVAEAADAAKEVAADAASAVEETVADAVEAVEETVEEIVDAATDAAEEAAEAVEDAVETVQEAVADVLEAAAEVVTQPVEIVPAAVDADE